MKSSLSVNCISAIVQFFRYFRYALISLRYHYLLQTFVMNFSRFFKRLPHYDSKFKQSTLNIMNLSNNHWYSNAETSRNSFKDLCGNCAIKMLVLPVFLELFHLIPGLIELNICSSVWMVSDINKATNTHGNAANVWTSENLTRYFNVNNVSSIYWGSSYKKFLKNEVLAVDKIKKYCKLEFV